MLLRVKSKLNTFHNCDSFLQIAATPLIELTRFSWHVSFASGTATENDCDSCQIK